MAPEPSRGKMGSLMEQDCSSPDTSEQALLEASRTVSRSEPDLSSITPTTEKATESTAIMIDVHDSTVVQSEDPSLFPESLSHPSWTRQGWKACLRGFSYPHPSTGELSLLLLAASPSGTPVLQHNADVPPSPGELLLFLPPCYPPLRLIPPSLFLSAWAKHMHPLFFLTHSQPPPSLLPLKLLNSNLAVKVSALNSVIN